MLPATLLGLVSLAGSAAAQGFWASCSEWQLGFDDGDNGKVLPYYIAAACNDIQGRTRYSFLPINDCLANQEGQLVPGRMGGLTFTCDDDCTQEDSRLTCTCSKTVRGSVISTIDLNEVLRNVNGIIACFDFLGIEVDSIDPMPF